MTQQLNSESFSYSNALFSKLSASLLLVYTTKHTISAKIVGKLEIVRSKNGWMDGDGHGTTNNKIFNDLEAEAPEGDPHGGGGNRGEKK